MSDVADIIDSLGSVAWPVVIGLLLWRLAPTIASVLSNRDVTVRGPGDMEITVAGKPLSPQRAVDHQRKQTEELRADLSRLAGVVTELHRDSLGERFADGAAYTRERARQAMPSGFVHRILWVDDNPSNNVYEIAAMQDRGIEVVEALTTSDGLRRLAADAGFDAVITDMSRFESGRDHATAGLDLLRAMRQRSVRVPGFVYCAPGSIARYAEQIYEAGALGATTDSTELFELLGVNPGPLFHARLQREVGQLLAEMGEMAAGSGVDEPDFTFEQDERRIGVTVRSWDPLQTSASEALPRCLRSVAPRDDLDELWVVCPEELDHTPLPPEIGGIPLHAVSIQQLRQLARTPRQLSLARR